MTTLVIVFALVSVFLFLLVLGVYAGYTRLEKRLDKMQQEVTLLRDVIINHNTVITKYTEATDYLLVKDGALGVYMGEKGIA